MKAKIFLSYRREDSAGHTGRLHDHFVGKWGFSNVFYDIDNIPPGVDFVEAIDRTLDYCSVAVVVIGPRWISSRKNGKRRIDLDADFHRLEIKRALERNIHIIPVLVGGAQMPSPDSLPVALRPLARRNAFEISDKRFGSDVLKLINTIEVALSTESIHNAESDGDPNNENELARENLQETTGTPKPRSQDQTRSDPKSFCGEVAENVQGLDSDHPGNPARSEQPFAENVSGNSGDRGSSKYRDGARAKSNPNVIMRAAEYFRGAAAAFSAQLSRELGPYPMINSRDPAEKRQAVLLRRIKIVSVSSGVFLAIEMYNRPLFGFGLSLVVYIVILVVYLIARSTKIKN